MLKKKMTKLFRGAILGAPASGKGTISSLITKKFDIEHISIGDIFRQQVAEKTPLGKSVEKYMLAGKLVPDVLVVRLVLDKLKELTHRNWLCDGFPRTLVQAEKLLMAYPLSVVINLKVPTEVIIERAKSRWVHIPSGRIYNTEFQPPKVPGKDDVTGEPLVQRPDDTPEAVERRLKIYEQETEALVNYYKKQGILKEFRGNTTKEIWPHVENLLLTYMKTKS